MMTNKLNFLCWEGYEQDSFIRPFSEFHKAAICAQSLLSDFDTANRVAVEGVDDWHVLNINNAYIKNYLYPRGLVKKINRERFLQYTQELLPAYQRFNRWTRDGDDIIGVGQRYGSFNLVVNTDRIDRRTAEDQGFNLANDPANRNRFGILSYLDFNLFHICIGSNLNPFDKLTDEQERMFLETARRWCDGAAIISDNHFTLNQALVDGDIDFYISGGVYVASPARRAGHLNIRGITPRHGSIAGRGGIAFAEVTSVLNTAEVNPLAEDFLEFILQPENALKIAFCESTSNPVAQMGNPKVFNQFSCEQLDIIQWDSLEEDLSCCADYDLMPNHDRLLMYWISTLNMYKSKCI